MTRVAVVLLLAALRARAQVEVSPERLPAAFRQFEAQPGEKKLRCAVLPMRPVLNFGFRFQAGWVMRVPLDQFEGKGHQWGMLARVTPEGGAKPLYLASAVRLPVVPKTRQEVEVGGGFLLGEGKYRVDYLMADERGRVCRKSWTAHAARHRGEHAARLALLPNTASDLAMRGAKRLEPDRDADVRRLNLTVFLHAAPMSLRRTRMRASDRVMLLGTLGALLEQLPVRNVRLAVFNLEQQKVLLRQDGFTRDGLDRVSQSLNELELGTVDYRVLKDRRGHVALLADMVNRELAEQRRSDAVIVLGPATRFGDKIPEEAVEKPPDGKTPGVFYFQLQPYSMSPVFPDALKSAVGRLKGKTITVRSPADFARAIAQVLQRAGGRE
jgi:hypothetical protein